MALVLKIIVSTVIGAFIGTVYGNWCVRRATRDDAEKRREFIKQLSEESDRRKKELMEESIRYRKLIFHELMKEIEEQKREKEHDRTDH